MKQLFTILFSLSSLFCNARAFHVSGTGSDGNSFANAQTTALPWATIAKINTEMASMSTGDSILFERGFTYVGSITLSRSGLYFGNYGTGAAPVFTGNIDLTWTNIGGNLWQSQTLSFRPKSVEISGAFRLPGRMPKTGYYNYESSSGSGSLTDNELTGNWNGADVCVRKNHTTFDKGVASQSGTTITYTPYSGDGHTNGYGYFLQNDVDACTINGDWYYNSSTSRVVVYSTSTPSNCKASQYVRGFYSNSYTAVINGIDFTGYNDFAVRVINTTTFTIKNSTITNIGDYGISFANISSSSLIESCTISRNNNGATIVENCPNNITRLNTIADIGFEGQADGAGVSDLKYNAVSFYSSDGFICELNSIVNTGFNGIIFYYTNNLTIEKNFVNVFNLSKADGGGIYSYDNVGTIYSGWRILNNIVLNGHGAFESQNSSVIRQTAGIYLDDDVANGLVQGNTCAGNAQTGIFIHSGNNITLLDNTLYDNGAPGLDQAAASQMFLQSNSFTIYALTVKRNIFYAKTSTQYCIQADFNTNTIASALATLDSNWYCHPVNEGAFKVRTYIAGDPSATFHTFAQWKTYTGKDAASAQTYRTTSSVDSIRLEYNATNSAVNRSLPYKYVDHEGVVYDGSITLQPYTSKVLIYQSAATVGSGRKFLFLKR